MIVYKCWNPSCERYAGLGYAQRLKNPTSCPHCQAPLQKEDVIHPWATAFAGGSFGLVLGSFAGPAGAMMGLLLGLFIAFFFGPHLS